MADLKGQYLAMQTEFDQAIHSVLCTGQFVMSRNVQQLEQEIAALSGCAYAVGVNSGTDALEIALKAVGVGLGDEVVTTPFTFVATNEAIVRLGARPVYADIDPETFLMRPDLAEAAITERTKALLPVDLYGQMADREAFTAVARRHGIRVVYDAAQAVGAQQNSRPLASWPDVTTLSFFPTKNLGAFGDGGMILTDDPDVNEACRQLRVHGTGKVTYVYESIGYCSRLDELQAAVLRVKLPHIESWNSIRAHHAEIYTRELAGSGVVLPATAPGNTHVWHQYTIRHSERDRIKALLAERGIDCAIYYPLSLHMQSAYVYLGYRPDDMPESHRAATEVLSLPVHHLLQDDDILRVADAIRQITGG